MRLATWPASVCRRGVCAAGLAMLLSLAAFLAPMDAMAMRRIDPGEYHAKDLTLPLMQLHGREYIRVDSEHTRRAVTQVASFQRKPGPTSIFGRTATLNATQRRPAAAPDVR